MGGLNEWAPLLALILGVINVIVIGPAIWLFKEVKAVQAEIQHVRASRPTRDEMKEYVTQAQRPTELLLQQMQQQLGGLIQMLLENGNGRGKG